MVPAGGELDEGEVLAHERGDHGDVGLAVAQASHDHLGDGCPRGRVVAGAGDLADVVQERREQQQVGSPDASQQPGGMDDRLDEVAVHGVPVDGVALGTGADRSPLGQPALDDALLVQALPHGDEPGPGGEQVAEQPARQR